MLLKPYSELALNSTERKREVDYNYRKGGEKRETHGKSRSIRQLGGDKRKRHREKQRKCVCL